MGCWFRSFYPHLSTSIYLSLSLPLYLYLSSPTLPCGSLYLIHSSFTLKHTLVVNSCTAFTTPRVTADHRIGSPFTYCNSPWIALMNVPRSFGVGGALLYALF